MVSDSGKRSVSKLIRHFENGRTANTQEATPVQRGRLGDLDWAERPAKSSKHGAIAGGAKNDQKSVTSSSLSLSPASTLYSSCKNPQDHSGEGLPHVSSLTTRFSSIAETFCNKSSTLKDKDEDYTTPLYELAELPYDSESDRCLPLPASAVFSREALRLHLPALDRFLSDKSVFPEPNFSAACKVCSTEEKKLFGLTRDQSREEGTLQTRSSKASQLSIGGRQLAVPDPRQVEGEGISSPLRHRRNAAAESSFLSAEVENQSLLSNSKATAISLNTTSSEPVTRASMFPPLMLLKTHSLNELKSNAVGPLSPPAEALSRLPGLNFVITTVTDLLIGLEGGSLAMEYPAFELLIDFAQLVRLNTAAYLLRSSTDTGLNRLFLNTIPSLLALDFISVFGMAIVFFFIWIAVVSLGLLWFWHMARSYDPDRNIEGYEGARYVYSPTKRRRRIFNMMATFLLTALYLPLTQSALGVLVWSTDFWVQTTTATDESNVCWTTTVNEDAFNWAWLLIPVAIAVLALYTLAWPIYLANVVRKMKPSVSEYNELGVGRSPSEMECEYQRQLGRDKSPLNFLYNDYNRFWPAYKSFTLLVAKGCAVLLMTLLTQDNCVFRKYDKKLIKTICEACLLVLQTILLLLHLRFQAFVNKVANRSELCGRITYIFFALCGLLVAVQVKGYEKLNTYGTYVLYSMSYGATFYFMLVTKGFVRHGLKRWQNRLDLSIDIYNPLLDFNKHVKRRIWEETFSIVLLSGIEYRMPAGGHLGFAVDDGWPPYLLDFKGSVAERHVENLKILKTVGMTQYRESLAELRGPRSERWQHAVETIQRHYTGPDAYFRPRGSNGPMGVTNFFGKAFVIPFPPTLVMRYDQQKTESLTLTTLEALEQFIEQNSSEVVQRRRMVRILLRALDGEVLTCPFSYDPQQHSRCSWTCGGRQKTFSAPILYEQGRLKIQVKPYCTWEGYNFSSGFDVSVIYKRGQMVTAQGSKSVKQRIIVPAWEAFGLNDDFELSGHLRGFFDNNAHILHARLPETQDRLRRYREYFHREAVRKQEVLSYGFLTDIFDEPTLSHEDLRQAFSNSSFPVGCESIQTFPDRYPGTLLTLYERLAVIQRNPMSTFWWLWWDDIYRQNNADYAPLKKFPQVFDPRYPTSIAYRPQPRARLVALLRECGFWQRGGTRGAMNNGQLNRLYFTLNRLAFDDDPSISMHSIKIGQGAIQNLVKPHHTASLLCTSPRGERCNSPTPSTLTGGGTMTSPSGSVILDRPAWEWEQRLSGAIFDPRPSSSSEGPHTGSGPVRNPHHSLFFCEGRHPRASARACKRFWTWTHLKTRMIHAASLRPYRLDWEQEELWVFVREEEEEGEQEEQSGEAEQREGGRKGSEEIGIGKGKGKSRTGRRRRLVLP